MSEVDTAQEVSTVNGAVRLLTAMWRGENVHQLSYKNDKGIFTPLIVSSISDAISEASKLTAQKFDVYFACGEYATPENRKAINSVGAWGFWIDIDCGKGKYDKGAGYLTKKEASDALVKFYKDTGLPQPTHLVDSGNGIHAYWALDRLITSVEWQSLARKFKTLTVKHGLTADPTRTADIASVLRVPDTNNYKDKSVPKLVKLKYAKPNISADDFISAINASNESKSADLQKLGNDLVVASNANNEPYPYDENKLDFYDALCAAFPNPSNRDDWREGVCALAYLVMVMRWHANETRLMRLSWENLAVDADKSDNEAQWQDALARTADRVKAGETITTHLTILKKARENGWQPKTKVTDALAAVQNKYALISLGGKVGIIDKHELEATNIDGTAAYLVVMSRIDGGLLVQRYLTSEHPQVDSKGTLAAFMLSKDTAQYNGVEFNPRNTTPNVLNLWVGPTIEPKVGEWPLIHTLLHDVLCGCRESEYQYLIGYLAHALQHPWEKPGVMIILLGGQGIGKGTLAKLLRRIWSATFLQVNRIKQVVGDFNGSLERAYIVFLDEALFAGDRNSSDALKSLVTEPTISINEKHQPARQITSYHRFFSATNADHFKATDRDDRRDFVLRVSEHRKGDYGFWNALNAEIENGGAAAFTHDLMAMDLTGFNVRAKPNTRELTEQKLQSLEKFPRWWFDCLSQGKIHDGNNEWPDFVSSATLLRMFSEAEKPVRTYKQLIDRDIVSFMTKMCPSAKREQGMEGSCRRRGYIMPDVEIARSDFEKYIGDSVEWEVL